MCISSGYLFWLSFPSAMFHAAIQVDSFLEFFSKFGNLAAKDAF